MKGFIVWTGVLSALVGAGVQFPAVSSRIVPGVPTGMLLHLFGLVAMFLGVMLVFCARDLKHRGVLVAWEGVLRLVGGAFLAGFGFFGDSGTAVAVSGLGDFTIGLTYLVLLPRHLGVSLAALLRDHNPTASEADVRHAEPGATDGGA